MGKKIDNNEILQLFTGEAHTIAEAGNILGYSISKIMNTLQNCRKDGFTLDKFKVGRLTYYTLTKGAGKKIVERDRFIDTMQRRGIEFVAEHRFHSVRKWRFDYANVEQMIAVEVEGGAWKDGRHNRATGFFKDMEKYNTATAEGWKVLRCTPQQINTSEWADFVQDVCERFRKK